MDELIALARRIAPDLADGPLYIVECSPDVPAAGYIDRHAFWHFIGSPHPPGPTIAINRKLCRDDEAVRTTAVHELAHAIVGDFTPSDQPPQHMPTAPDRAALMLLSFANQQKQPQAQWIIDDLRNHGHQFWRCLAHLTVRTHALGLSTDTRTNAYAWAPHWSILADSLADEIGDRTAPLRPLLATRPPERFVRTWNTIVGRRLERHGLNPGPHLVQVNDGQ